jgi:hypothetical protein
MKNTNHCIITLVTIEVYYLTDWNTIRARESPVFRSILLLSSSGFKSMPRKKPAEAVSELKS